MQIIETPLAGLLLIEPRVFGDDRGYFFESYNRDVLANQGITGDFVQDNESLSDRGVVRGLHFQVPPKDQGKLVRVQRGKVWDVAVDIRRGSPTYGKHYGAELSGENKRMLWIPRDSPTALRHLKMELYSYINVQIRTALSTKEAFYGMMPH